MKAYAAAITHSRLAFVPILFYQFLHFPLSWSTLNPSQRRRGTKICTPNPTHPANPPSSPALPAAAPAPVPAIPAARLRCTAAGGAACTGARAAGRRAAIAMRGSMGCGPAGFGRSSAICAPPVRPRRTGWSRGSARRTARASPPPGRAGKRKKRTHNLMHPENAGQMIPLLRRCGEIAGRSRRPGFRPPPE